MWSHFTNRLAQHQPLDTIEARRICIIKPSALGDVVQALPVLNALRARFPTAHIAWVVNRSYAELLEGHPQLNEVIPFDRGGGSVWSPAAWQRMSRLCDRLRRQEFDLACDLQGLFRSGLMTGATRAPRRIGLGDAREGSRIFYSDVLPIPPGVRSAVERYWRVAEAIGAGSVAKQFVIRIDDMDFEWAERQMAGSNRAPVAIHAGARWMTKRWPAGYFGEIAQRLARDFSVQLLLVGGSDAVDASRVIETAVPNRCTNLVGQTNLRQLAALLSRVQLLITNDSGPMHLAAALRTPVAGIFTCTSPDRARPFGPDHVVCATNVWCAASYLKRCSRLECFGELTPDRVWPAISGQMARLVSRRAA